MKKKFSLAVVAVILATSTLFGAGEVQGGKVSAYLKAPIQSPSAVKSALQGAGFEIVGEDSNNGLTTILFTCPTLKKFAAKPHRGFVGVMRVLIDNANGTISVMNPLYFGKAFLQKDFDEASMKKVLSKINSAFAGLENSGDKLKYSNLSHYHFMMGMPYYEEMDVVGKGSNTDLIAKAQASGKAVYTLNLGGGQTLIGIDLGDSVESFVNTIGTNGGAVLPYSVLIEDSKAKILAPKYNIALRYPKLKMTQFMKISSTPGKIESAMESLFK